MNYYNEFDKHTAALLRELVRDGLIPAGEVDERSITEVRADDLRGYTQCHFFAGIGGWPLALRLAGWPEDRSVWTGSCPCQPFSVCGKRKGGDDERHLWPEFFRLIAGYDKQFGRVPTILGEQVASADGRLWLAGVRLDLEALGYAVGAADLCAAGVGAPHIRQRLYWVANSNGELHSGGGRAGVGGWVKFTDGGIGSGRLADSISTRLEGYAGHVANGNKPGRFDADTARSAAEGGGDCGLSDADGVTGRQISENAGGWFAGSVAQQGSGPRFDWGDNWIRCADGKARRIEPGLSPLAHGIPARVVRLRGYGNAIVPQVAAEFIIAADAAANDNKPTPSNTP